VKKKPVVKPPEKMVIAGILSTFDGRLESFLADKFAKGYALSCPPTFVGKMAPYGMNEYAVGYHPHFLVILQKLPTTLNQ
jgi:hypothetical protein